ncbi:hypothetical protein Taro_003576 [Colocasia esculenta]|uniref:Uncharacterized protein n=1 Tax=Colocasia esculenta TaxID=4460 RepID=A0A843TJT8_COLES|nr:hypothetical protein [Colocasia esculenta]
MSCRSCRLDCLCYSLLGRSRSRCSSLYSFVGQFPVFGVPTALAGEGLVIPTEPCSRGSPPYFLQLGARCRGSSVSDGLQRWLWRRVLQTSEIYEKLWFSSWLEDKKKVHTQILPHLENATAEDRGDATLLRRIGETRSQGRLLELSW